MPSLHVSVQAPHPELTAQNESSHRRLAREDAEHESTISKAAVTLSHHLRTFRRRIRKWMFLQALASRMLEFKMARSHNLRVHVLIMGVR